ncbi:MAG: saccharopine dehydrogenase NADP-binding domain-containing protein [Saprospiraceae bacterium]|nr:saccharopine dehydrogenase NADP-binding domain-containing protein [Saprospiraceae bacterium]
MSFLLYGANGYTGQLITEMSAQLGLKPVLAGRNEEKIRTLAEQHGLDYRVFDLNDPAAVDKGLEGISVVLHTAGPFIHTARPMMEACLRNRVHYLDITGEIGIFEMAHGYDTAAREAGILLMSGVGFDVVPTDCAALYLKNKLPDAIHLRLAFASIGGGLSHGTALTMAEGLGQPGAERQNGRIVSVPLGKHSWNLPTGDRNIFTMSIPWGDVSTAWYSTGIPNVITFTQANPQSHRMLRFQFLFNWLLRTEFMKNRLRRRINTRPAGPSASRRQKAKSIVWGEARNASGAKQSVRLTIPEGYTLTAITSLLIVQKVLAGNAPTGFQTPAMAFGADLIMEVEGAVREDGF